MPNIIGVRVTHYQPNGIVDMETHDLAHGYGHDEAGRLDLYDAADVAIKTYQSDAWSSVELVYGEDEPAIENLMVGRLTFGGVTAVTADQVEQAKHEAADHIRAARIEAATRAFVDELETTASVLDVVSDDAEQARRVRSLRAIASRLREIVDGEAAA